MEWVSLELTTNYNLVQQKDVSYILFFWLKIDKNRAAWLIKNVQFTEIKLLKIKSIFQN